MEKRSTVASTGATTGRASQWRKQVILRLDAYGAIQVTLREEAFSPSGPAPRRSVCPPWEHPRHSLGPEMRLLSAASLATLPLFLFMRDASAPSKTSCQCKPSVMTKIMCWVWCSAGTCARGEETGQVSRARNARANRREEFPEISPKVLVAELQKDRPRRRRTNMDCF
jgi:hypothetical protein